MQPHGRTREALHSALRQVAENALRVLRVLGRLFEHEVVGEAQHVVEVVVEEALREAEVHVVVQRCMHCRA